MKTLLTLAAILLPSLPAFATMSDVHAECSGKSADGKTAVDLETNLVANILDISVYPADRLPLRRFIRGYDVTGSSREAASAAIYARRDERATDGALLEAALEIQTDKPSRAETYPAVLTISSKYFDRMSGTEKQTSTQYPLNCTVWYSN